MDHERKLLSEFISLYIDLTCLWDIDSDFYKDRSQRAQAWQIMTSKLKELEPEANINTAKKRIDHMKYSFRREYKKVKESKRTGAGANPVYVPQLWYYNLLLPVFEKKYNQSRCGVDTLSSDEEFRSSQHEKNKKKLRNISEEKKETLTDTSQELLLECDSRKEEEKKISPFVLYVGEQLDQVETFQRQVAEKLISEVLFLAKTGNLNFNTRIEIANSQNISYTQQSPSYYIKTESIPSPPPQHIYPSPSRHIDDKPIS